MPAKLWTEQDGEAWIDNPRRGRKRRRRAKGARHRRSRRSAAKGVGVARKRSRRRRRHKGQFSAMNPRVRRRGRRRFRRNPFGGGGGIMTRVKDGIKGGIGVVVGKAAARAIPAMIGQPRTGLVGIALQAAVGVLLTPIVARFGGSEFSRAFLWGAFASPIESLVVGTGIPILAPALSSYADELSAIPRVPGALSGDAGAGMPGFTIDDEEQGLVQ